MAKKYIQIGDTETVTLLALLNENSVDLKHKLIVGKLWYLWNAIGMYDKSFAHDVIDPASMSWNTHMNDFSRKYMDQYLKSMSNAEYIVVLENTRSVALTLFGDKSEQKIKEVTGQSKVSYGFSYNWVYPEVKQKKVIVVSPFARLMKRQFESGNLAKIRPEFQPSEVLFYQFPYCFQNNGPDQNSFETIEKVKNDLSSIVSEDCSILFSCGSMGLSIADYFFNRNVNVFYCGGGLQIFFGIMGERWRVRDIKSDDSFLGTYLTHSEAWISQIPEEFKPENSKSIENGCYW